MSQIDPAERLLNLIIALTHVRTRLTRAQIMETVNGYSVDTSGLGPKEAAKKLAAFERMFERDKEDLRRMGIPLQTVVDEVHGDEIGYRIDPSNSAMQPIDLSPAELAVTALAHEFWSDAAVSADARQALTKIASGGAPIPRVELPLALRSSTSNEAFAVLADAIHRRCRVTFEYSSTTASGLSTRNIEPWQLQVGGGAQYVVGFDVDRQAPRTFRLGRIVGRVATTGDDGAYTIPETLPRAVKGDENLRTAVLALRPETGHALRELGQDAGSAGGWDIVLVTYRHDDALLEDVFRLGGAVRIIEPTALAEVARAHARAAVEVSRG